MVMRVFKNTKKEFNILILLILFLSAFVLVYNMKLLYADGAGYNEDNGYGDCFDSTNYVRASATYGFGGYEIGTLVKNNKVSEINQVYYPNSVLSSSKRGMMIYYYVFDPFGLELGNGTTKIESRKWVYDKVYLPDVIYNHYKVFSNNPKPFNVENRPYCMVGGLYRTYYHKSCNGGPTRNNRYLTFYCHTTQDLFDSILIPSDWNKNLLVYCNYGSDAYVENELPDLYIGGRNLNVYRGCVVKNLGKSVNNTVLVTADIGNLALDNHSKYILNFTVRNGKLEAKPVRILQAFMDKNKNGIKKYKLISNIGTIHYNLKENFAGPIKEFLNDYYKLIKSDPNCAENTEVCTYYFHHLSNFLPDPAYFKMKSVFKDTKIKFLGVSKTSTKVVYNSDTSCFSCGRGGGTSCDTTYYYFNIPNTFYFLIENATVTVSKISGNPIKYLEVTKNVTIGDGRQSELRDYFLKYIPVQYSGMGVTYITDFDYSKFNKEYITNLINPPNYFEGSRVLLFYYIGPGKGVYGYEIPVYKYYLNYQNLIKAPDNKVAEFPIYFVKFKDLGFTQKGCMDSLAYYNPTDANSPVNIYNSKITCLSNGVVINSLEFSNPKEAYLLFLNLILGINN